MPVCADAFEPNNDLAHAKSVAGAASAAVCPAGDIDLYSITLPGSQDVTVDVTYASGGPLMLAILNSGGTPITNGVSQTGGVRAVVLNLPAGTYYARVTGTTDTEYQIAITQQ
jgi:hypothetical protein